MTFLALSLVLLAAVCHATWNFLVKRLHSGPELVWLFSVAAVLIYLPVATYAVITGSPRFGATELIFYFGTAVLHGAYFLTLQYGYRHGDLSVIYPTARATGPLLSSLFAILILAERPSPQVLLGGAGIIVGIVFLTGGFKRRADHLRRSLIFGLLVGVLIGAYTIWDAWAVQRLSMPPLVLEYVSRLFMALLLLPFAFSRRQKVRGLWRQHKLAVIVIGIVNPLAYILVLYALTTTPVVYVAPAREVSVLIAVVLGSVFLGEGMLKQRLGWATLILAGMIVLATG